MFSRRVINTVVTVAVCAALVPAVAFAANGRGGAAPQERNPLFGAPTSARTGSSYGPELSSGVIYRTKPGTTPQQVASRHDFGTAERLNAHAPQVATVHAPKGTSTQQLVATLQADPAVEFASPNYIRHVSAYSSNPNDTYFQDMTQFDLGGRPSPYAPDRSWWLRANGLNITPVWGALANSISNYGPRSDPSAFKVGVIDTGFYMSHEDRGSNIVAAKDECSTYSSNTNMFVTDGDVTPVSPSAPLNDVLTASHGTCVAGEIGAATNNALGVAAAGWDAQVRIYKVQGVWIEGDGSSDYPAGSAVIFDGAIVNAIYDATNDGCKILNISLGGPDDSAAIQSAIDYAYSQGVIVVSAAGNDDSTAPSYPAGGNHVLSVGAMGLTGTPASPVKERSSFSNYGPTVDLMAPGESIWGLAQPGYDADGPTGDVYYPGYYWWDGTSMASPAVAGTLAALWRFEPTFSADEMVNFLEAGASGGGTRTDTLGYGYVDANGVYQKMKLAYPALGAPAVTGLPASGQWGNKKNYTASWPLEAGYSVAYAATLDGSTVPVTVGTSASSAITALAEGSHTVTVKSSSPRNWYDPNGFSTTFRIDTVAPLIAGAPTTAPSSTGWYRSPVTVHFTASDAASGVSTVSPDVAVTSQAASETVVGTALDVAGNAATATVSNLNVDYTPPSTSDDHVAFYTSHATVHLTPSDAVSGVASTTWTLDGAPGTGTSVSTSVLGSHTLTYWCTDVAGNVEDAHTITFSVTATDLAPPITTISGIPDGWTNGDVTFSLSAFDADTPEGIATYFGENGPALTPYVAPVTISAEGTTTVSYSSVDALNNAETPRTALVLIDRTAPSTTDDHVTTYTANAAVHLTPTDQLSGVGATEWTLDGTPGSGTTVSTSSFGHHTLVYWSVDNAGNMEGPHTVTFAVIPTPRPVPVYRFYDKKNGSHFYTASSVEKANVLSTLAKTYSLDGVAYVVNAASLENDAPLYRFYNKKNGSHFYTASESEKANVLANLSATYSYDGPAYDVCLSPVSGSTTVWRFYDKRNGTHFYTADPAEKADVIATRSSTYSLDGPAFYLAP